MLLSDKKGASRVKAAGEHSPPARQAVENLLLLASAGSLFPEVRESFSRVLDGAVDWDYLFDLAEFHGVSSLVAHNILADRAPGVCHDEFKKIYHHSLFQNIILSDELNKILIASHQAWIPVIAFKGMILADLLVR